MSLLVLLLLCCFDPHSDLTRAFSPSFALSLTCILLFVQLCYIFYLLTPLFPLALLFVLFHTASHYSCCLSSSTKSSHGYEFMMHASKVTPNKLAGSSNYRTWAKDMELSSFVWVAGMWPSLNPQRTPEWKANNNWARSEIHLWCNPDQQDHIIT